jgi:hypothetical protein
MKRSSELGLFGTVSDSSRVRNDSHLKQNHFRNHLVSFLVSVS